MKFQLYKFNSNIHGLRGIAALFVIILHFFTSIEAVLFESVLFSDASVTNVDKLVSSLSSGVEFFFMISGFLITASLLRHKNISSFLVDRAIRIYPVFLSIHIPFFLIMPFFDWKWLADISFIGWLGHFMSNALFLPGVFNLPIVQSPAWTLSYEFLFYLTSSLILFLSIRMSGYKKYALFLLILLPLFILFPRGLYFLVGTITFLLMRNKEELFLDRKFYPTFFFFIVLIILGPLSYGSVTNGDAIHADEIYTKIALFPAFLFFVGIVRSEGYISILLRSSFFQFLGKISYSLYLWHAVILFVFNKFLTSFILSNLEFSLLIELLITAILFFASTLLVAYVSYYLFENKVGGILKDYKKRSANI